MNFRLKQFKNVNDILEVKQNIFPTKININITIL